MDSISEGTRKALWARMLRPWKSIFDQWDEIKPDPPIYIKEFNWPCNHEWDRQCADYKERMKRNGS